MTGVGLVVLGLCLLEGLTNIGKGLQDVARAISKKD